MVRGVGRMGLIFGQTRQRVLKIEWGDKIR